VYQFAEGHKDLKDLLGGKGANLAEMTRMGLPVPPGFTITTEACTVYLTNGQEPCELRTQVDDHLGALEATMGKKLGQSDDPLLVSVRSGARFSMPGMMETVLNIGLNDESVRGLALQSGNERFAFDSYRRLIQMFGKTALGVGGDHFENALDAAKQTKGAKTDLDLDAADLHKLIEAYKQVVITGWKPKAASPAQCTSNPVPRITPGHHTPTSWEHALNPLGMRSASCPSPTAPSYTPPAARATKQPFSTGSLLAGWAPTTCPTARTCATSLRPRNEPGDRHRQGHRQSGGHHRPRRIGPRGRAQPRHPPSPHAQRAGHRVRHRLVPGARPGRGQRYSRHARRQASTSSSAWAATSPAPPPTPTSPTGRCAPPS